MPTDKLIGGNRITDADPLQVETMGGEVELATASLASLVAELNEITAALAGLPAALGQAAAAASVPVVEAKSTTGTTTSVNDSASSVVVLAANADRIGATIYNDSTSTLYLKYGTTASATDFTVKMFPDDYHEVFAKYAGIIHGIWSADASGAARVTELT